MVFNGSLASSFVLHMFVTSRLMDKPWETWKLPSRRLMGEFRINIDWASMLYARQHIFSEAEPWFGHLRLDSSPQFAKNYLVAELDRVSCDGVSPDADSALSDIQITVRLLPLQVLGKLASSTSYKMRSCNHMLNLEIQDGLARVRLRSLMSDMGTESGLWNVPNFDQPNEKFFPLILPIADLDHGIHHAMQETADAYDSKTWSVYDKRLSAISKMFSRRDMLDRFVKFHIWDSHLIPPCAKKSLATMFRQCCPSLCKHRWQFNFEVLRWITKRQQFFQYLQPQMISESRDDGDMGRDELAALTDMLKDEHSQAFFWAMAWLEYMVHSWGFSVSRWLHGCPCHSALERSTENQDMKCCKWNGRRLIQVSEGKLLQFCNELLGMTVGDCSFARDALSKLKGIDMEAAMSLHNSFQISIKRVALRFKQATSYLVEFLWSLPKLLGFTVPNTDKELKKRESKEFARKLLEEFDSGKLKPPCHFDRFFKPGEQLGQSLRFWASETDTCDVMPEALFTELVGYSACLLVMQRLEARHHLVSQRMSVARASTPMTLSANLRRSSNSDSHEMAFRENFELYLSQFHTLLPDEYMYTGRLELSRLVSGYHFDIMFADRSTEQSLIQAEIQPSRSSAEHSEHIAHLKSVLKEGSFYAIQQPAAGNTSYLMLQLLSLNVAGKRYMQKVVKWSEDPWFEKLGVVVLGTASLGGQVVDCEDDAESTVYTPPAGFTFASAQRCPTEVSADTFFVNNFEGVYEFGGIDYKVGFAWDAITDILSQDSGQALLDLNLMILVPMFTSIHVVFCL